MLRTARAHRCLEVHGVDEQIRKCANAPSERVPSQAAKPIIAESFAQADGSAPVEVYATARADVEQVVLEFSANRCTKRRTTVLLHAHDARALEQASIDRPFGLAFAELPPETSIASVTAIAQDQDGTRLGAADFGFLRDLHPRAFIAGPP